MATVLPPPSKRQRVAIAEKAKEQQEIDTIPDDLGSIRVQFWDQATNQSTGAPVSIPVVDATVKNLELLLNTLQQNVGSPMIILFRMKNLWFNPLDRMHLNECPTDSHIDQAT